MTTLLKDWTEDDWQAFHVAVRTYGRLILRGEPGEWPPQPEKIGNVWRGGTLPMHEWLKLGREIQNLSPEERMRAVRLWRELNGMEMLKPTAYYKHDLNQPGFVALARAMSKVTKEQMLQVKCALCGAKVGQMCVSRRIAADGSPVEINRCHVYERAEAFVKKAIESGEMERGQIKFPRATKARKP